MIAVLFEMWPAESGRDEYFARAAALRPLVDSIDGFLGVERFESLTEPGKVLSLSFFRDELAVAEWRAQAEHRAAQKRGREALFRHYRVRVAAVLRDYGKPPATLRTRP
ncbi:MAG: antibiotic biosynthesis monooxygenase [Gemmatimonadales bacterium]